MQQSKNDAAIKKEKDARKSPRKEKVDVKSEKVARKSPSKEQGNLAASIAKTWQMRCLRLEENE